MKTLLRSSITALCLAMLPLAVSAADQSQAAVRLTELPSSAQTVTGGFSHMTLSANGANLQQTTGTLTLKRPVKVRWHTDPPLEQLLISDGEKIWLYDPDLEQVT